MKIDPMPNTKDILLGQIRSGGALTAGQELKLCLMLSYPAIIAQLSSVLMQYIDTSMVGHLGAAAGASIGLVTTCIWLLWGFCGACGSGFSVQVAHLIGANDFKAAREVLRQGLVSALVLSGGIALVGIAISGVLPYWLGGSAEIASDATRYFFIVSAFMPFMQIDWMCASMLQVSGNMKVPSYLNIGMCVLDVCFNYLFIYVLGMGVVGAALGTGLAELVTSMAMLYFVAVRSPELNLLQDKGSFRPTARVLSKAADIGGPMALQNILIRGGYIASTIIVAPLGTIAIAANAFAITAESFCYMPGYGIADAATALVGQSVGAGRKELAQRFAWITIFSAMVIMGLLAILMYIFSPELMGLLTPDGEVIRLGAKVLRIEAFAELGYAASIVAYGACVGAGDTKWPSVMNFTSMWIVRILPAIFLVKAYGLVGFWIAMAVELTFRGAIFLLRIARKKWLEKA
jgi:putative MATE family efflux protein